MKYWLTWKLWYLLCCIDVISILHGVGKMEQLVGKVFKKCDLEIMVQELVMLECYLSSFYFIVFPTIGVYYALFYFLAFYNGHVLRVTLWGVAAVKMDRLLNGNGKDPLIIIITSTSVKLFKDMI